MHTCRLYHTVSICIVCVLLVDYMYLYSGRVYKAAQLMTYAADTATDDGTRRGGVSELN